MKMIVDHQNSRYLFEPKSSNKISHTFPRKTNQTKICYTFPKKQPRPPKLREVSNLTQPKFVILFTQRKFLILSQKTQPPESV